MQFYVNESEAAIRRVETINHRLSSLISDLTGPEPTDTMMSLEKAMCGPSGFLPQLSNNMGELSGQLRRSEELVDRLEAILGLDRPSPARTALNRLDGRN